MIIEALELYINVSTNADFYDNTIISQPQSSIININCNNANLCNNNTINAQNTQNSLSFHCTGHNTDCSNSIIHCPFNTSASCNIHCSSCPNTNIFTTNGVTNLDWKCQNTSISCLNSKLFCGGPDQDNETTDYIFIPSRNLWQFADKSICSTPGNSNNN